MNPPVDAPRSRARRPSTATSKRVSAASSFSPPRPTKRGPGPSTLDRLAGRDEPGRLVGRGAADGDAPGRDVGLGLLCGWAPGPAAPARRRGGGAPADQAFFVAGALLAGRLLLGRRLLGGRLLRGRLLGRRLLGRGLLRPGPSWPSPSSAGRGRRADHRRDPLLDAVEVGLGGDAEAGDLLAHLGADRLEQLLAVLAAALEQVGDRVAGLVRLHLADLHQVLHQLLRPGLGEGREGEPGVDVALQHVVLSHRASLGARRQVLARVSRAARRPGSSRSGATRSGSGSTGTPAGVTPVWTSAKR